MATFFQISCLPIPSIFFPVIHLMTSFKSAKYFITFLSVKFLSKTFKAFHGPYESIQVFNLYLYPHCLIIYDLITLNFIYI